MAVRNNRAEQQHEARGDQAAAARLSGRTLAPVLYSRRQGGRARAADDEELVKVLVGIRDERDDNKSYLSPSGPGSKQPHRGSFRKAFRRAVERTVLDPELITPYVMRHIAISRLVNTGVDLPTIQRVRSKNVGDGAAVYPHRGLHINAATEALSTRLPDAITPELHTPSAGSFNLGANCSRTMVPRDGIEPPTP